MRAPQGLFAVWLLCASVLSAPAFAQDAAAAKALFKQGLTEMQASRYETACPALEASYRLDPRLGTLFTLAECEAKRGRLATAAALYDDYLAQYARLPADQQLKQGPREQMARAQQAAFGPQIPQLTLVLPPNAPRDTVVKRDGTPLASVALGIALPVDPGEHVMTTQAPGGKLAEIRVTMAAGEKKEITLTVKVTGAASQTALTPPGTARKAAVSVTSKPEVSAPSAPPVADQRTSGRRVGAYVVGGMGVAGLVLGGVTGAMVLGKKSVIEQNCNIGGIKQACNDTGLTAAGEAKTLGLTSSIGFGVGIAAVGAAIVLFVTEPARKTSAATPHGLRAAVLTAGPGGATVGLQGAW